MNDIHTQNQVLHKATLRLLSLLTTYRVESELLQKGIEALALLLQARYGAIALGRRRRKTQTVRLCRHPSRKRSHVSVTCQKAVDY